MKTHIYLLYAFAVYVTVACSTTSCNRSGDVVKIVEERDSLRIAAEQQKARLDDYTELLGTINTGMDSIARSESVLFVTGVTEGASGKEQVLNNLMRMQNLVASQKARIDSMERRLNSQKIEGKSVDPDNQMALTIANFKRQLAEKNAQIVRLRQELSRKDADISVLKAKVGSQSLAIAELDRKNSMQSEALKRQDAALNQCYMAIGTKKELQNKGIIRKGKLVTKSGFDRSVFAKVDIRRATEFQFSAKHPKILTAVPESSYTLTTDGKGTFKLRITNPTQFWSISNFLVIQTN